MQRPGDGLLYELRCKKKDFNALAGWSLKGHVMTRDTNTLACSATMGALVIIFIVF